MFALIGLSDSFNITGIYDKNGISARVTYNWRRQISVRASTGASRSPVFVEPFGTLDANISYDITPNSLPSRSRPSTSSAKNVVNYGRDKTNLWFAQELKPRVLTSARAIASSTANSVVM